MLFFPSPCCAKRRESQVSYCRFCGRWWAVHPMGSGVWGSSHLPPSPCTEHWAQFITARNPGWGFQIVLSFNDHIVGWLLLRLSWDIILTLLYSKQAQKPVSCIKSDRRTKVIEINWKWGKKPQKYKLCGENTGFIKQLSCTLNCTSVALLHLCWNSKSKSQKKSSKTTP